MDGEARYLLAPDGWSPREGNPFTGDGSYGNEWSCLSVRASLLHGPFSGRSRSGCWMAGFGREDTGCEEGIADFIRYENGCGRTVILVSDDRDSITHTVKDALSCVPPSGTIRAGDPPCLIHSTTAAAWRAIEDSGELVARAFLPEGGGPSGMAEGDRVGSYMAAEPPEFADYVMFGAVGGGETELVVASRQHGRFDVDLDAPYEPGARLYLDNRAIIRDGLAVRDGLHAMKVRERLPLSRYLIAVVTPADLVPDGGNTWTPNSFAQRANVRFSALATNKPV